MSSLRAHARAHRFAWWLALIAIAGLALRIAVDVALRHHAIGGDGFRYHFGSLFLADGKGFRAVFNPGVPDTGHPPGWTILLAGVTKLFDTRTWFAQQIVTSFVGTATIVMVGVAAKTAFGKGVGLIAAVLTALYPFIWVYEREVLSEPLALLLIATTIWLVYKFLAAPSAGLAIALGATIGAVAMTKSDQLAIGVLLVAPVILSRREVNLRRRVGWLAMAAAVCIVIMAPWSVYMSARFHRTVVVTGSIGGAMAAGNCAQTYTGPRLGYYVTGCARGFLKPGDPFSVDNQLRHRAIDFMRAHERRTPVVMAARVGRTFGFFRPFQQMHLETERGTPVSVFRVAFFAYWALLPFAVAGAVIARRRTVPIYPFLVFPALSVFTVALTIGSVRYRAPAEIPLVILAAVALEAAFKAGRQRLTRTAAADGRSTTAVA